MEESHFDQFYRSIYTPEDAFRLYLCPHEFNPLELSGFSGHRLPSVFSEALIHFLFSIERRSGYAKLQVQTDALKQGKKIRVKWESGISELGELDESEVRALKRLTRDYLQDQMSKYGHTSQAIS